jgi:uncharacterized protein
MNDNAKTLSGPELRHAFEAGARCLERHRDLINALNVFPVPDGDTGTNMLLTLRAGLEQCPEDAAATAGAVTSQLAQGVFWGARGNSGVILSQFFKGFAAGLQDREVCAVADLSRAFQQACDAAYRAVGSPVEGTMLSVMRGIAEGSPGHAAGDMASAWESAFVCAREALARTPEQLPVLKRAGVVDAGGLGVVAIVGGVWGYLRGREPEQAELGVDAPAGRLASDPGGDTLVDRDFRHASQEVQWGYCTQFVIEGQSMDPDQVRQEFTHRADSVVVIGDERNIRVHVHALDPGPVLSYGTALGQLSQIKIENMSIQSQDWAGDDVPPPPATLEGVAVVAVAPGEGLDRLFREAGCAAVISGGQTMNPSVQQIMAAVQQTGAAEVIVLPNNKNIVVAAEQAASNAGPGRSLWVVPSRTVPQGVAAMLAFNAAEPLEPNLQRMRAALSEVATVEVTRAVRDVMVGDLSVVAGQYIGVVDGELRVTEATAEAALCAALDAVGLSPDSVVTLFWGAEATQELAENVAHGLGEERPGIQVDVVYGGQPHYPYLASVE